MTCPVKYVEKCASMYKDHGEIIKLVRFTRDVVTFVVRDKE
jgi:hypothetical protein